MIYSPKLTDRHHHQLNLLTRQCSETSVSSFRVESIKNSNYYHEEVELEPEPPLTVCFVEEENEYYEDCDTTIQERQRLWYCNEELRTFRDESKILVKTVNALRQRMEGQYSCVDAIVQAHDGFCHAETVADLKYIQDTCSFPLRLSMIGLERKVSKTLYKDRRHRRAALYHCISEMQSSAITNPRTLANLISHECRAISLPNRRLAQHIAMQSWLSNDE